MSTSPTTDEATGLVYKQLSNYKEYPARASTPQYDFQVRDAGGVLLATYNRKHTTTSPYTTMRIPHARFKNVTLVIKGLIGGTGTSAIGIFPTPHY